MTEYRSCTFLRAISAARNAAGSLRYAQGFQRLGRSYFSSSFIRNFLWNEREVCRALRLRVGPSLSSLLKDTRPHDLASFGRLSSSLVVLYLASAVWVYMCISGNTKAQIECSTLSIPPYGIISGQLFWSVFWFSFRYSKVFARCIGATQLAASRSMDDRRRIYHRAVLRANANVDEILLS